MIGVDDKALLRRGGIACHVRYADVQRIGFILFERLQDFRRDQGAPATIKADHRLKPVFTQRNDDRLPGVFWRSKSGYGFAAINQRLIQHITGRERSQPEIGREGINRKRDILRNSIAAAVDKRDIQRHLPLR